MKFIQRFVARIWLSSNNCARYMVYIKKYNILNYQITNSKSIKKLNTLFSSFYTPIYINIKVFFTFSYIYLLQVYLKYIFTRVDENSHWRNYVDSTTTTQLVVSSYVSSMPSSSHISDQSFTFREQVTWTYVELKWITLLLLSSSDEPSVSSSNVSNQSLVMFCERVTKVVMHTALIVALLPVDKHRSIITMLKKRTKINFNESKNTILHFNH